jgi:hypothetical protein
MWKEGDKTTDLQEIGGIFTEIPEVLYRQIKSQRKSNLYFCETLTGEVPKFLNGVLVVSVDYDLILKSLEKKKVELLFFRFHTHPKDPAYIQPPSLQDINNDSTIGWGYPYRIVVSGLNNRMYFYDYSGIVATLSR